MANITNKTNEPEGRNIVAQPKERSDAGLGVEITNKNTANEPKGRNIVAQPKERSDAELGKNKQLQAVRGMNDILPDDMPYWHKLEQALKQTVTAYGYQEIRFPLVEATDLFVRSIGEVTDIVEKEMYTFTDKSGDSLSLRPEGTAGCVRAALQHGLLHNQTQKFWYQGAMFRHERPQKGRYRQFHQFGIEAFGFKSVTLDIELFLMMQRVWQELGLSDLITLEINSLGTKESRQAYRGLLIDYFKKHLDLLDEDAKRRLETNPLRILDSKNSAMQELIQNAPKLIEHLDAASRDYLHQLTHWLDLVGITYKINHHLVRGLDYYSSTVFEWTTTALGSQSAVCAGGHYDALISELGGKEMPAAGFALGMERLVELLKQRTVLQNQPVAYFVMVGDLAREYGLVLAEKLRTALPGLLLSVDTDGGSFAQQFKRADKSGAKFALVIADEEMSKNFISLKYLREEKEQQKLVFEAMVGFLRDHT